MRRALRGVVAGSALLWAGRGTAQTLTPLTPLATLDDVRTVCAAPDAGRFYTVTLPSAGFSLQPYDAARARLAVDAVRGFHGSSYELVLHHIAGSEPVREGGLDIAMPTSAAEAAELAGAKERGELRLELVFQLAAPGDGSPVCALSVTRDGEGMRAAIEPVAFEILRGGARVASGESARFSASREAAAAPSVGMPRVTVVAPTVTSTGSRAPARVARAASALRPRLLGCYRLGLGLEPTLRGPFVAGVDVAPDGRVVAAHAELDGLGSPQVASCVLGLVRATRFPGAASRLSIPMRFSD